MKAGGLTAGARRLQVARETLKAEFERRGLDLPPMRQRRLEGLDSDVITGLLKRLGTASATATVLGVCPTQLLRERQRRGLPTLTSGKGRPRLWAAHEPEIRRLHALGFGPGAIARALHQPYWRIYAAMRKMLGLKFGRAPRSIYNMTPPVRFPEQPEPTDAAWATLPMEQADALQAQRGV